MIYILATDVADASAYALQVLGVPLRRMVVDCKAVIAVAGLPQRFEDADRVKMTPAFENMVSASRWDDVPPGRTRFSQMQMTRANAKGIWSAAVRKGRQPEPAYDVPERLDRDSIEAWLAEG